MGILGKSNNMFKCLVGVGMGKFGGLSHFTDEAMKSQLRGKKSRLNDKLIGEICGPQGLVLMWRPDRVGWYVS